MSQAEVPLEWIHVFYGKWVRSIDNIYISEYLANTYKSFTLQEEISDHLPCLLM